MKTQSLIDKAKDSYTCSTYKGRDVLKSIDEVSVFRLKYFLEYPYLYVGNEAEEKEYLKGFSEDPKSLLLILKNSQNKTVAVSTSMPLVSSAKILDGVPEIFREKGLEPEKYFYYGEVIIHHEYRARGLTREIFRIQENYGREIGLNKLTLSTVFRESRDPRKPSSYVDHGVVWSKMGFTKTDMVINYKWPTLQIDQTVKNQNNKMEFYIKNGGPGRI